MSAVSIDERTNYTIHCIDTQFCILLLSARARTPVTACPGAGGSSVEVRPVPTVRSSGYRTAHGFDVHYREYTQRKSKYTKRPSCKYICDAAVCAGQSNIVTRKSDAVPYCSLRVPSELQLVHKHHIKHTFESSSSQTHAQRSADVRDGTVPALA